jgi:hypothetical protein
MDEKATDVDSRLYMARLKTKYNIKISQPFFLPRHGMFCSISFSKESELFMKTL